MLLGPILAPGVALRGVSTMLCIVMRNGQLVSSTVVDGFDLGNAPAPPANAATVAKPVEPAKVPEGSELAPRAIDERVAYQLVSMMRDVVQRGTGTAAKVLERPDVGGKTGSTNDHRDACDRRRIASAACSASACRIGAS